MTRGRRIAVRTPEAPAPGGHYSQAIVVDDDIYVAGSGPHDPITHKIVGRTIKEQTEQTLRNIQAILNAAGASLTDVVKVTVYLRRMSDFAKMDAAYKAFFAKDPPARTTVQVGLFGAGRLVAIDAVAVRRSQENRRSRIMAGSRC
jgi:2-iminobutanoate/2-iminopropanoate deaminase